MKLRQRPELHAEFLLALAVHDPASREAGWKPSCFCYTATHFVLLGVIRALGSLGCAARATSVICTAELQLRCSAAGMAETPDAQLPAASARSL